MVSIPSLIPLQISRQRSTGNKDHWRRFRSSFHLLEALQRCGHDLRMLLLCRIAARLSSQMHLMLSYLRWSYQSWKVFQWLGAEKYITDFKSLRHEFGKLSRLKCNGRWY